jgi:cobyric acid synthase
LADALTWTLRATSRPVWGVVPWLRELGLPEEDSLGLPRDDAAGVVREDRVTVAVVVLPHLSNFTDFDALRIEPDITLRFVDSPEAVGDPDVLVLPGSKNVFSDLAFLRRTGWDTRVAQFADEGRTLLVGICGGFQMLGESISDPYGLEGREGTVEGLGLLPMTTALELEKTLRRTQARHLPSALPVSGYQIHHGRTALHHGLPTVERDDGEVIGIASRDHAVWGSYLHGIFDADAFRRWFIDELRQRRALLPLLQVQAHYDLELAIQRLTDTVRASVDVKAIYRELGL